MGYTNYWNQPDFTDSEWEKIKDEFDYIKEICDKYIVDETTDDNAIIFNGIPEHETFALYKSQQDREKINGPKWNMKFNFCKTARKPYDIAVWHLLYFANTVSGNKLDISRDW